MLAPFVSAAAAALALSGPALPPPSFTVPGSPTAFAAAGARVSLATGCSVRVANLARGSKPVLVKPVGDCRSDPGESWVDDLRLGRTAMVERTIISPSPHGDAYELWEGPLPAGPLHSLGDGWGWRDDDVPSAAGCAWSVAAGGGVLALAKVPNTLGIDGVQACPAGPALAIRLIGAARASLTVPGSWSILATDGGRLALARLDAEGERTGELALVDVNGGRLQTPRFDAATVKAAYEGRLAPQGLVLQTARGISGSGWTIAGGREATVAEGRLFYLKRRTIRVRRLRDGMDRALPVLPTSNALLASGSFGLAVATGTETRTSVYRLPWRTIDRTLRP